MNRRQGIYEAIDDKMWRFLRQSSVIDDNVRRRASIVFSERPELNHFRTVPVVVRGAIEMSHKIERP